MKKYIPVLSLTLCTACGASGSQTELPAPTVKQPADSDASWQKALNEATEGVDSPALREVLRGHWAWVLESDPLHASRLGVHRFDDRISDNSRAGIAAQRAQRRVFLQRLEEIDVTGLSERDRDSHRLLKSELASDIASEVCDFPQWTLNARSNPVTEWNYLPEMHNVETETDGEALLARYRKIATSIDNETSLLGDGAKRGLFAPAETVRRVIKILDTQLAKPLAEWPLLKPVEQKHEAWPADAREQFRSSLQNVVAQQIKPALTRYRDFVAQQILPSARSEDETGLAALSIGEACYRARSKAFTTLPLNAEQIHRIGLEQIAKTDQEMAELGAKVLGAKSLSETLSKLREDRKLYFDKERDVAEAARETLRAAKSKMSDYFGTLPKADCVVVRIPDYEAPFTTIAYYRPPHADGSKPGEYFINVFEPLTRPRYEAAVLAVHEAIPGHHLQIAISQELSAMPAFRKYGGVTAYVEGWALYTERLADEMGLYATDLDRIGMVSFDAWRAGRLVVDTGIHAMGWSRSRAQKFLLAHTALSANNIDNEVDRYISWPGQALGYKIGQLEIWKLRREAEGALGAAFKLADFHDTILRSGAVSLPILRERVQSYIDKARR